jgi:hypothetical protein
MATKGVVLMFIYLWLPNIPLPKYFFLSRSYVKKIFFGFMIFDDVFFSAMMGMSFFQV